MQQTIASAEAPTQYAQQSAMRIDDDEAPTQYETTSI